MLYMQDLNILLLILVSVRSSFMDSLIPPYIYFENAPVPDGSNLEICKLISKSALK